MHQKIISEIGGLKKMSGILESHNVKKIFLVCGKLSFVWIYNRIVGIENMKLG